MEHKIFVLFTFLDGIEVFCFFFFLNWILRGREKQITSLQIFMVTWKQRSKTEASRKPDSFLLPDQISFSFGFREAPSRGYQLWDISPSAAPSPPPPLCLDHRVWLKKPEPHPWLSFRL